MLDVLTVQFHLLSKPVDPILIQNSKFKNAKCKMQNSKFKIQKPSHKYTVGNSEIQIANNK